MEPKLWVRGVALLLAMCEDFNLWLCYYFSSWSFFFFLVGKNKIIFVQIFQRAELFILDKIG